MNKRNKFYCWLSMTVSICLLLVLVGFLSLPELPVTPVGTIAQIGLQRSRIERMTKDILLITGPSNDPNFTQAVSELQVSLPLWERAERGLQAGDASISLPAHVPSDILLLVIQVQPDYVAMDTAFHNILKKPTDTGTNAQIQVQIVLDHEVRYYYLIGQIDQSWQDKIDAIQDHVYDIELVLVALVVVIVLVNFIGVIRWAGKIKRKEPPA